MVRGEGPASALAVLVVGMLTVLGLRILVGASHRQRLRLPIVLLCVGVLLMAAVDLTIKAPKLHKWVSAAPLALLLISFGRLVSVGTFDGLLVRRLGHDAPRILRDIVDGLFTGVALLITLAAVGVEATSLLTTSALLTAVIGLSLQDTLGNVFAGLALQGQAPFEPGDWIQLDRDGLQIGQVIEINWRATRLRTGRNQELTIPNNLLARSIIVNHSRVPGGTLRSVSVTLPYEVATREATRVLLGALRHVPGVERTPEPFVRTQSFADHGITYLLMFRVLDFSCRDAIEASVRDRAWYALRRAGIRFAIVLRADARVADGSGTPENVEQQVETRGAAIRNIGFLRDLPDSAIEILARESRTELFCADERVVNQGERGEELYLCLSGELIVVHEREDGSEHEVARIGEGGLFGEFSQLTGEARAATVRTATECSLIVVPKPAFVEVLKHNPAFAELISARLAERQAELEAQRNATPEAKRAAVSQRKGEFLSKLRGWFRG